MTSPSELPSSPDELIRQVRRAQSGGPVSPAMPELNLGAKDAGMLDLAIAVEQLITVAGGANVMQMLHAAIYLVGSVEEGMREGLTRLSSPGEPEMQEALQRAMTDAATASHTLRCLKDLAAKPTSILAICHLAENGITAAGAEQATLRFLVSERALLALELDPDAFYADLRQRHL
jgi:hypothetical protein